MTPVVLLEQLKLFTEEHTKDLLLPVKVKPSEPPKERAAEVWPMRLPNKKAGEDKAPYLLLQVVNGSDSQEEGQSRESVCYVRIVGCVYCEDESEGAMHLLNLITRLRTALLEQRVIGGQFVLRLPLEYLLYPNDTAPFFLGELSTMWSMPAVERKVNFIV